MLNLYRYKISSLILIVLLPLCNFAQQNMPGYDQEPYHFGFSLGYNRSDFRIIHSSTFINHDSILVAESTKGDGAHLGIIGDLRVNKFMNLRMIPTLSFAEKRLHYKMIYGADSLQTIESVYMEFPLTLKFKSERIENFRMYVIGGVKYSYDFMSNSDARNAKHLVKIAKHDLSVEYGLGMDFYFPMFKLSPEIKFANGILNIHTPTENLNFAEVLKSLLSRSIMFSLHFE